MASALDGIPFIEDFDLTDKKVFLRLDLNVPIRDGVITDDSRIVAALPTIKYALDNGAKLILASHMGRPKSPEDKKKLSLEPVATEIGKQLGVEVILIEDPRSDAPKLLFSGLKNKQLLMLENLRFDPDETKNGEDLVRAICEYADIYINDAFGASHRAHSTIVALPQEMNQCGIGFLMKREIEMLEKLLHNFESPFTAILGGAKVSDKIGVIENLVDQVDQFMVGGAMAYTLLKANGVEVGSSLVEENKLNFSRQLIERLELRKKKLFLPVDHLVVKGIDQPETAKFTEAEAIDEGWIGVDIGPKTIELYRKELNRSKTIFWNGPMGIFENSAYSKGTYSLAQAVSESEGVSVVGGGDSASAAKKSGFSNGMTHLSTGGGASLEFLQGDTLPGLQVLKRKHS